MITVRDILELVREHKIPENTPINIIGGNFHAPRRLWYINGVTTMDDDDNLMDEEAVILAV